MTYERDAIRPNVFGKFREMLGATAKHPAMLLYLDNAQSTAPVASRQLTAHLLDLGGRRVRAWAFDPVEAVSAEHDEVQNDCECEQENSIPDQHAPRIKK
jgi:hypothetical protein